MDILKKTGLILCMVLFSQYFLLAGPIDDAKNNIYYEKYNKAIDILQNFLLNAKLKEVDVETATFYLGRALILANQTAEAKKIYQNILVRIPASAINMVGLGGTLLIEGNLNEAQTLFDNATLQTKSKDITIFTAIAYAYTRAKNTDPKYAQNKLTTIHEKAKKNAEFHIALGDFYKRIKHGGEAYSNYQLALSIEPNNAPAKFRLAKLFLSQNNKEMFEQNMIEVTLLDKNYAPAFYELYLHFYNIDISRSKENFIKYKELSEKNQTLEFEEANVLFASKDFPKCLQQTLSIIDKYKDNADIRCFRLAGYTYNKLNDSINTVKYLETFLSKADPDDINIDNYRLMANTLAKFPEKLPQAAQYMEKAYVADTIPMDKITTLKALIALYKKSKNNQLVAYWSGILYQTNIKQSSVDLFNWGYSNYVIDNFVKADSIFSLYIDKYPNEYFGYLWKARTRYTIDTPTHESAIPLYLKTIEFCLKDSLKFKNNLIEAYGVLYNHFRSLKNFEETLNYINKLLIYKPEDQDLIKDQSLISKHLEEVKKYEARKKEKK